jgi:hypothetical protein
MRRLASMALVALMMCGATSALAVEVPGKVIYKMPSGELVRRDVTLDVPPRGQGKVVWKTANYQVESHAFKTKKHLGRTIFSVLFLNVPGAPAGTAMALVGSYLRGSNEVIYYGDVYGKHVEADTTTNPEAMLDELLTNTNLDHDGEKDWHYAGGFKFNKEITK